VRAPPLRIVPVQPERSRTERVLIVTPTRRDAEVSCQLLRRAGIDCQACDDLRSLAREARAGAGVLLLTDVGLVQPGIEDFFSALESQPAWSDIPIVVLSGDSDRSLRVQQTLAKLTNVTLLDMPSSTRSLVSAVESALRARRKQYEICERLVRQSEAEEALRQADRRKDEFLATLAHELRNPLGAVRNGLQVLMRGTADAATSERMLGMMDRQSRLLIKLIDDLLDVSRIATGKMDLRRDRLDLRAVVEAGVEMGQTGVDAGRHELRIELPAGPLWAVGDQARLAQVVGNLVNNAAKYTPDGGRIHVSLRGEGVRGLVRVADNGVGMPAEAIPHVFEMFTQVNRTLDRSQGGLGIGLSLVHQLVELHGGSVQAESNGVGKGSTFTLRLPLAQAMFVTAPPEPVAPELHAESLPRRLRLLVIDDNADVADSLAALLEESGHEARTEYGGAAGIRAAVEFAPDVVFCDIGMPGINGHEVAFELKAKPQFASTLLVAVTGWGSDEHHRRTREAGFDVHLTKPVDPEAVQELLARI
jgi:two-component system, sensor histidine kinase